MTQDPYEQSESTPDPYATTGGGAVGPPKPAPMGRRAGAALIDFLILMVFSAIWTGIFGESTTDDNGFDFQLTGLPFILLMLISFGYFIVLEATQGKTIGKMALGLRAVGEDGKPLTWGTSAARNLLRIIDGIFLYLIGFIIAMTNERRQRLGDMVAKTIVIEG